MTAQYKLMVFIFLALALILFANISNASYTVTQINTTVIINLNSTAQVMESINISISNESLKQYSIDRAGLNLTLSNWQSIISPQIVPHIINPKSGVYGFNLLPGPIKKTYYGGIATIYMNYYVKNVTSINQTGPRNFIYTFNSDVLNFAHGSNGVVLSPNTRLNIILPPTSKIISIYPIPDSPQTTLGNFTNITKVSWFDGEPLYNFKLVFVSKESIFDEVIKFFNSLYAQLGIFLYLIIIGVVLAIIFYTYIKNHK